MRVSVKKGYDFKVKYSYSDARLLFYLNNPYNLKNSIEIKSEGGGVLPGRLDYQNTVYRLGIPINKTVLVETVYSGGSDEVQLITRKRFNAQWEGTANFISSQISDIESNHRIIFGLTVVN